MSVTKKYMMRLITYNLSSATIMLTKKAHDELLKQYQKEIRKNHEELAGETDQEILSDLYLDDIKEQKIDRETCIETIRTINDGGTYIDLISYECKPGYCFKSK